MALPQPRAFAFCLPVILGWLPLAGQSSSYHLELDEGKTWGTSNSPPDAWEMKPLLGYLICTSAFADTEEAAAACCGARHASKIDT
jgi:hypothetical protein